MLKKAREKIDQALRDRVDQCGEDDVVEAVLTYNLGADASSPAEAVAHSIMDEATRRTGTQPVAVQVLPKIGAMHVAARTALLCQLLADDRVSAGTIP